MEFSEIGKSIMDEMGALTGVRVYSAIADRNGDLIFFDSSFEKFKDFIKDFIKHNFSFLHQGEHSIPLSSQNIIFFKGTETIMFILYNPKGRIGQLLSFKTIMKNYIKSIENSELDFIESSPEIIDEKTVDLKEASLEIVSPLLGHKRDLYSKIKPVLGKKNLDKEKFSIIESMILNKSNGINNLLDIIKTVDAEESKIIESLYDFIRKKFIDLDEHELIKIQCHECKNSVYSFIPKYILNKLNEKIRLQSFSGDCGHTFLVFIDKNLKIETRYIEKLLDIKDSLDLLNLSIKNLISFFGQDMFFRIFRGLFFQIPIVIIGKEEIIRELTQFLKKIFSQIEYNNQITGINEIEFGKNAKKYKDCLVIDLSSNISINIYEDTELFDFETKLFKSILNIEDDRMQILKTYSEFERLILNTDTILKEIGSVKEISEDDLMKIVKEKYDLIVNRYEIPIIKNISEIYYETNISKKITRTVVGQFDRWFNGL